MTLNNNEIILKEILPKKSFFFNTSEKIRVVFSIFYLLISLVFLFSGPFFLVALPMLVAGLYFVFFRWVLRYFDLKDNYFVITNERIIIAEKKTQDIVKEKRFSEIDQIHAEMNNNFFGNIIFGEPETFLGKTDEPYSFFKGNNGMNFSEDKYAFLSVENINEIILVLENLNFKVNRTFY